MIVEEAVLIAAPPERIYDLLVDPATWFKLDPTLLDVQPRDRLVVGGRGVLRNRPAPGMKVKAAFTTRELIPGRSVVQHLTGRGYVLTEAVAIAPEAAGSRMTVTITIVGTSLYGRILTRFSRGITERDLRRRFANLRALVEAPTSAT